jgi:monoamine oxidase
MPLLNRRQFLSASAALIASPALAALPKSSSVDVVIVGAGAAGIAAARRIIANGHRVVVLEAGGRVGGRCITDTTSFGVPFDRGAHWIHVPKLNPVLKLADARFDINHALPGQRLRIGRRNARESEAEDFLVAQVHARNAIADAKSVARDVPANEVLPDDLHGWRQTIEFVLGPYGCGKDLAQVSAKDLASADEYGVDAVCRQGYGALLASLAMDLPIVLSTPVTRIEWNRGLDVYTADSRLSARAAIVTASTNVLASGAIEIRPELPPPYARAFAALSLGNYEQIALELPGNPLGLRKDDLIFEKATDDQTAALLGNVSGTDLCILNVGGRFGRALAAQGEAAMIAFAIDWLTKLYGSSVRKAIRRRAATNWDKAPYVRGAFAAARPGGHPARQLLMKPLHESIWFAGEAVHERLWGTVGGAWASGERAADAVLTRLASKPSAVSRDRRERHEPQARSRSRAPTRHRRAPAFRAPGRILGPDAIPYPLRD